MVGRVDGGLDDDTAIDAQGLVHPARGLVGRARRVVGGTRTGLVSLAADVKLAVAAVRRRRLFRGAGVGIERQIVTSRSVHFLGFLSSREKWQETEPSG